MKEQKRVKCINTGVTFYEIKTFSTSKRLLTDTEYISLLQKIDDFIDNLK